MRFPEHYRKAHPTLPPTKAGDPYGFFVFRPEGGRLLNVIATAAMLDPSHHVPWDHVSVSVANQPDKCPGWAEMCAVKELFFEPEEAVIQYHPPHSQYVNHHAGCLHLWRPVGVPVPTPPPYLVGPLPGQTPAEAKAEFLEDLADASRIILEVNARVRYWEDATVNGERDADGTRIPHRLGDSWNPRIDVMAGVVLDWPKGTTAKVHYKVCDDGNYWLNFAGHRCKWKGVYVPTAYLSHGESGYGDYIVLDIDAEGAIADYVRPLINPELWEGAEGKLATHNQVVEEADGSKHVVDEVYVLRPSSKVLPIAPHEDGDYSYTCLRPNCRCCN